MNPTHRPLHGPQGDQPGDVLQAGDEWMHPSDNQWNPVMPWRFGKNMPELTSISYRRTLPSCRHEGNFRVLFDDPKFGWVQVAHCSDPARWCEPERLHNYRFVCELCDLVLRLTPGGLVEVEDFQKGGDEVCRKEESTTLSQSIVDGQLTEQIPMRSNAPPVVPAHGEGEKCQHELVDWGDDISYYCSKCQAKFVWTDKGYTPWPPPPSLANDAKAGTETPQAGENCPQCRSRHTYWTEGGTLECKRCGFVILGATPQLDELEWRKVIYGCEEDDSVNALARKIVAIERRALAAEANQKYGWETAKESDKEREKERVGRIAAEAKLVAVEKERDEKDERILELGDIIGHELKIGDIKREKLRLATERVRALEEALEESGRVLASQGACGCMNCEVGNPCEVATDHLAIRLRIESLLSTPATATGKEAK